MKTYFEKDEWNIIQKGMHIEDNRLYESVMSLGNGYMGIRGNFEEDYSGDSLSGTYIAGVYYPDKTRVGWWKNGYPEYFAKVLNATNFIGVGLIIDGETIDLAKTRIKNFMRSLDMKNGVLTRNFIIIDSQNRETEVEIKRFLSLVKKEVAAVEYNVRPICHDAEITFIPYLDGNVRNEDSNYDENFWAEVDKKVSDQISYLTMKTKKLDFYVTTAMKCMVVEKESSTVMVNGTIEKEKYVANKIKTLAHAGKVTTLYKYISVTNNRYMYNEQLVIAATKILQGACNLGFEKLYKEHCLAWEEHWKQSDIVIEGDVSAQQAIRFNIFQLNQTYTGEDAQLNIGPKGFTGEKYGGSTYWDTEAYCIPFYLSTQNEKIARNLLIYRYNQLDKAKENAKKLGLSGALYPMVTMNGDECHNEWEITFEEIHRNAAIAYAIFNYVRYTGDEKYLLEYGFDVLVETSRFWASRIHYNPYKEKYMMLGVTGPNEYENNVNNNWYTNTMAVWNLRYTIEVSEMLSLKHKQIYDKLIQKLNFRAQEIHKWKDIIEKMYFPYVTTLGVFEQQDGYMDKEQILVKDLPKEDLPINQMWSWDRILRSCFIKQADVLQGLYFLNDEYDMETKKKNFDFYEPRTVHESSLSPCIHSILACEIGYHDKAYELYLRTARLDLDNYNNDTEDGLHITSMAGTWMSITYGFGGLRIINDTLNLKPFIPRSWSKYSFKLLFRGHLIKASVDHEIVIIKQESGSGFNIKVFNKECFVPEGGEIRVKNC
jgi:maltose phosphorylase